MAKKKFRKPIRGKTVVKKTTKKQTRKPRVGDEVYLKGEAKHRAMTYKSNVTIDGEVHAYCTLLIPNMESQNLDQCLLFYLPLDKLTLEPPASPTQLFVG